MRTGSGEPSPMTQAFLRSREPDLCDTIMTMTDKSLVEIEDIEGWRAEYIALGVYVH